MEREGEGPSTMEPSSTGIVWYVSFASPLSSVDELIFWAPRICLCAWVILEVMFWLLTTFSWSRTLDQLSTPPPYREDPERLVEKILRIVGMLRSFTVTDFLRGWFLGAPLSNIRKGNVEEFLAWAMFAKEKNSLDVDQNAAVARVIDSFSTKYGIRFEAGLNPNTKCIKFTLEPMSSHVVHRPLLFYVVCRISQVAAAFVLSQAGFIHYNTNAHGLSYWYRPSPQPNQECQAIPSIFFHGITPGICWYLKLLRTTSQGRSTMIVDVPSISMNLDMSPPPQRKVLVASMRSALAKHGIDKACVAGHSYGTFLVAWMVQDAPDLVAQVILIDPMCFLPIPTVASNFLYKKPVNRLSWSQSVLHFGGATEIGVAKVLRRHFWWYDSMLWADDLDGIPTIVHLASNDKVCNAGLIREYLHAHTEQRRHTTGGVPNLDVVWSEGLSHAELLFSTSQQSKLARAAFLQECRILAGDDFTPKKPMRQPSFQRQSRAYSAF
mmetsp:Transcript_52378/g.71508  ORF Transcript_52378/g.71508 Transcript_52378/m.71508 type:complete len:494 (-) Transcript_52378:183-1664(-)